MSGLFFHWLQHGDPTSLPLLQIRDLHVRIGAREVLSGINFEVHEGDHVRITGPNGSGKSTLMNTIMGTPPVRVAKGEIELNGIAINNLPTHKRARLGIGYMRQIDNVFDELSVSDNLILALGRKGPMLFGEHFPKLVHEMELSKPAGCLSGGQKKKLAWGMAGLSPHKILLLDEPKAGVDEDDYLMTSPKFTNTLLFIEHGDE